MNVNPGRVPKGLRIVLEERKVNTKGMSGDEMREILWKQPDFKDEKSRAEKFLLEKEHIPYMLPKFHPKLNPIDHERVCAQAKRYTRAYCKYTLPALRSMIDPALDSVPLASIQKHFKKWGTLCLLT